MMVFILTISALELFFFGYLYPVRMLAINMTIFLLLVTIRNSLYDT
jgi:hypothetical protein